MVFFTNRCKNKNCPLFKKLYISTLHCYNPLKCLLLEADFSPHLIFQMNFHHFFLIHGPGSLEKSLGTNHRRAFFFFFFFFKSAIKTKARALSSAQLSRHYQTVSHTVLRGEGQVPAPRCGSVDVELLG